MERVERMPIRIVITKKIESEKLVKKNIEAGTIMEISLSDLELFNNDFEGYFQEIEMTKDDWIQLATEKALECKKAIDDMKRKGVEFKSYYMGVIPWGDNLVDGRGYGGGLPDAYYKIQLLEEEILNYQNKIPKFDVVEGMPIRIVITKKIESEELDEKTIEAGTFMDISLSTLEFFRNNFDGYFQEVKMTKEDWIQLATERALKCKKAIDDMKRKGANFDSNYERVIPHNGGLVDGHGFRGGLPEAYNKTKYLEEDVLKYQNKIPQFDVVEGMPIRIVITKKIESEKLVGKTIEAGTFLDIDLFDFEYFKNNFDGYFQEMKMTEESWIQVATESALKCKKEIEKLRQNGIMFKSYNESVIPNDDSLIDCVGYARGLADVYGKIIVLKIEIEECKRKNADILTANKGGINR